MLKKLLISVAVTLASAAQAEALSASATEAAVSDGALLWDVRPSSAATLPGALRADPALLDAWLKRGDRAALEAAITRAGIDLSRQVIVYGDAGDARAQALVKSLTPLVRGRVDWFVGGEAEWWQSGRPVQASGAQRHPVPQVLLASSDAAGRMAGASLRHVQAAIPAGVMLAQASER